MEKDLYVHENKTAGNKRTVIEQIFKENHTVPTTCTDREECNQRKTKGIGRTSTGSSRAKE